MPVARRGKRLTKRPSTPRPTCGTRNGPAGPTSSSRRRKRQERRAMRVLLAAMQCHKGEPARNLQHHCEILDEARRSGARIAVFPEMSLSGSVDPASRPEHLLAVTDPVVERLAAATAETGVAAVF